ncbi:MAG: HAMP domain-containing sensor histidine kinase [Roseovarius sp.]|nr:HAMP domain-containing sensor histidine kinase [Roseovarius sp.]
MLNSLSGRFVILTAVFVMLAEILIFVPSIARYREDFLMDRLERAQIASLALLADDMIDPSVQEELLDNAGVFNVVLRRDEARQLVLSSPMPHPISETFDLRDTGALELIGDAIARLSQREPDVIRVIGQPARMGGLLIEVTLETSTLRAAMVDYGLRILVLSAVISLITAIMLNLAVRRILVKPIRRLVEHMKSYASAPEDARRVIVPSASIREVREAEDTLLSLQTQLTHALKQRERLAQLGSGVAKISHDLRNILTSAQLFTDRIEMSQDPAVMRMAPKLVNSITRAVHLCESTLAFGKAEERAPVLTSFDLQEIISDVIESEKLSVADFDLSFSVDVPDGLKIRGDSEQMYRAIQNLARNARQAIVNSGSRGEISVSASETSAEWLIYVADTGPGLPPKAQEYLFQPFQGGTTRDGTGLGLSIAMELVRGHGGELTLLQTGPQGTTFRISLPKGDAAQGK